MAKFWTVQIFWSEFPIGLQIARTDYGLYDSVKIFANWIRFSHKSEYLSICGDSWDSGPVWNRGINSTFCTYFHLKLTRTLLNHRKVANERISVSMTNFQELMDFGWVAMELTNPWWTAGLRDPIKLYSHMNITDSMKVYHWTVIRRRY